MKTLIFLLFLIYIHGLEVTDFSTIMTDLENLEKYIGEYITEKSSTQNLIHLLTCYIREGAYSGTEWTIAGGSIPNDLPQYIIDKDLSKGTHAQLCKQYREIDLPNNEQMDFVHFFAVMNGIEFSNSYSKDIAHLVGWGGDTFQLLQDIKKESGNLEQLMTIAKNYFRIKGGFDLADFISDIDAPIILKKKQDENNVKFADIIKSYYNDKQYTDRINNFITLTFPSLTNKDQFREGIFKIYDSDSFINILECKDGIRDGSFSCLIPGKIKAQYVEHQKAAVYVVSDYLAENYDTKNNENGDTTNNDNDNTKNSNINNNSALLKFPLILLISIISIIL